MIARRDGPFSAVMAAATQGLMCLSSPRVAGGSGWFGLKTRSRIATRIAPSQSRIKGLESAPGMVTRAGVRTPGGRPP